MCSLITSKLLDLTVCSLYQASTHGTVFGEGSLLSWHLPFDMELKFSETKQVKSPNPKWWLLLNSVLNASSFVNVTGLGCAGPVWDDWVEPVWFLPPELCCLCRIFVPAWQAPTVINSLDHSACSLKQTKKWWGRVWVQGESGVREKERGRVTGRHIQWYVDTDRQEGNSSQLWDSNKHIPLYGWQYTTEAIARLMYSSALWGVEFPGKGKERRGMMSTLWTLITHSFKLHLDS